MSRKVEAIDLMKLYASGSHVGWNQALSRFRETQNLNGLARLLYSIQAGMDDLAKKKLNDEKMNIWFCRLTKSIEKTAKAIIRERHPLPGDNPLIANKYPSHIEAKRARDHELALFLRKGSY